MGLGILFRSKRSRPKSPESPEKSGDRQQSPERGDNTKITLPVQETQPVIRNQPHNANIVYPFHDVKATSFPPPLAVDASVLTDPQKPTTLEKDRQDAARTKEEVKDEENEKKGRPLPFVVDQCDLKTCTKENCVAETRGVSRTKLTEMINSSIKEAVQTIVKQCRMVAKMQVSGILWVTRIKDEEKLGTNEGEKIAKEELDRTICYKKEEAPVKMCYKKEETPVKAKHEHRSRTMQELCTNRSRSSKSRDRHRSNRIPVKERYKVHARPNKIREAVCGKNYRKKDDTCEDVKGKRHSKSANNVKTDNRRMTGNVNIYICSEATENSQATDKQKEKSQPCTETSSETTTEQSNLSSSKLVTNIRKRRRKLREDSHDFLPEDENDSKSSDTSNVCSCVTNVPDQPASNDSEDIDIENSESTFIECRCNDSNSTKTCSDPGKTCLSIAASDSAASDGWFGKSICSNGIRARENESDLWLLKSVCRNYCQSNSSNWSSNSMCVNVQDEEGETSSRKCCCKSSSSVREPTVFCDWKADEGYNKKVKKRSFRTAQRESIPQQWSTCTCIAEEDEEDCCTKGGVPHKYSEDFTTCGKAMEDKRLPEQFEAHRFSASGEEVVLCKKQEGSKELEKFTVCRNNFDERENAGKPMDEFFPDTKLLPKEESRGEEKSNVKTVEARNEDGEEGVKNERKKSGIENERKKSSVENERKKSGVENERKKSGVENERKKSGEENSAPNTMNFTETPKSPTNEPRPQINISPTATNPDPRSESPKSEPRQLRNFPRPEAKPAPAMLLDRKAVNASSKPASVKPAVKSVPASKSPAPQRPPAPRSKPRNPAIVEEGKGVSPPEETAEGKTEEKDAKEGKEKTFQEKLKETFLCKTLRKVVGSIRRRAAPSGESADDKIAGQDTGEKVNDGGANLGRDKLEETGAAREKEKEKDNGKGKTTAAKNNVPDSSGGKPLSEKGSLQTEDKKIVNEKVNESPIKSPKIVREKVDDATHDGSKEKPKPKLLTIIANRRASLLAAQRRAQFRPADPKPEELPKPEAEENTKKVEDRKPSKESEPQPRKKSEDRESFKVAEAPRPPRVLEPVEVPMERPKEAEQAPIEPKPAQDRRTSKGEGEKSPVDFREELASVCTRCVSQDSPKDEGRPRTPLQGGDAARKEATSVCTHESPQEKLRGAASQCNVAIDHTICAKYSDARESSKLQEEKRKQEEYAYQHPSISQCYNGTANYPKSCLKKEKGSYDDKEPPMHFSWCRNWEECECRKPTSWDSCCVSKNECGYRQATSCVSCCKPKDDCSCKTPIVHVYQENCKCKRSMVCLYCDNPRDRCICRPPPVRKCPYCELSMDLCRCQDQEIFECNGRPVVAEQDNHRTMHVTAWKPRKEVRRYFSRNLADLRPDSNDDCRCHEKLKPHGSDVLPYQRLSVFSDVMNELQQKISESVCCTQCRKIPCCCANNDNDRRTKYCVSPKSRHKVTSSGMEKPRSKSPGNCRCESVTNDRQKTVPVTRVCCVCGAIPCRCKRNRSSQKKPRAKCYYCKTSPCSCTTARERNKPRPCRCADSPCRRREKEVIPCAKVSANPRNNREKVIRVR